MNKVKFVLKSHLKASEPVPVYLLWEKNLFSLLAQVITLSAMAQFAGTNNALKMGCKRTWIAGLLWLHLQTREGQHSMENSLALFSTTFLWFLYCIFPGELDRRGCAAFSLFFGSFTLKMD